MERSGVPLPLQRLRYRRRFFFLGGFGGGFAALAAAIVSGFAVSGNGTNLLITNCCPIVQTLVVIQ